MAYAAGTTIYGGSASKNIEYILDFAKPEILVLDDIDRSTLQPDDMLKLLEYAKKYCRIVISTANTKGSMIGAMLRAGRIDDHLLIEKPDPEIVREMLDEEDRNNDEIVNRMVNWPIAYISNYIDIKEVFGAQQAKMEIDKIEAVIEEVLGKTKQEESSELDLPKLLKG